MAQNNDVPKGHEAGVKIAYIFVKTLIKLSTRERPFMFFQLNGEGIQRNQKFI